MKEWFAFKMLLQHQYPEVKDVESEKSFKELRSDSGGLKLALKGMTFQNWLGVRILQIGGRPMWNWWTKTVRCVIVHVK